MLAGARYAVGVPPAPRAGTPATDVGWKVVLRTREVVARVEQVEDIEFGFHFHASDIDALADGQIELVQSRCQLRAGRDERYAE